MKADLYRKITGFDDFKLVMETIGNIQSTTITIEIQLHEMQETYSVLEDHKIQVGVYNKIQFIYSLTVDFTLILCHVIYCEHESYHCSFRCLASVNGHLIELLSLSVFSMLT